MVSPSNWSLTTVILTCDPLGSPYVGVTCSLVGESASVILRCTDDMAESSSTGGGPVAHMRMDAARDAKTAAGRALQRKAEDEALACRESVRVAMAAKHGSRRIMMNKRKRKTMPSRVRTRVVCTRRSRTEGSAASSSRDVSLWIRVTFLV